MTNLVFFRSLFNSVGLNPSKNAKARQEEAFINS
jgi:hypothetical protein